jgi:C4-dicarboxylate-specific signal transduction histidine kinase/integral membrane sensor domain MASE1
MPESRGQVGSEVGATWSPGARTGLLLLAVAATYYLGAWVGFALRFPPATTSLIWPPNALLTAILLITPPGRWWLCVLAALPAHSVVELQAGFSLPIVLALFVTNCLEAVLAASFVHWLSDEPTGFDTLHRVIVFVAGAVFLAPLVSSLPDAAAVHLFQGESFRLVFVRRFFSNCLSQLTIVPSTVVVVLHGLAWLRFAERRRRVEALVLALGLVVLCALVFSGYQRDSPFLPGGPYTALPFLMPLLVFAGVRFGPAGASLSLLATALLAIASAMSGWTPLTVLPAEERVRALQVFLIVVGVPLLVSSALIEERRRNAESLRERLRFEALLSQLSGAFVQLPSHDMDREFQTWLERVARFLGLDRMILWRLTPDAEALVPLAAWASPVAPWSPERAERAQFGWIISKLLRQESFLCPDVDDLPAEAAAERERLRATGARSALALPLMAGEQVLGCLSLSTTRKRVWSDGLLQNCRLVADVFAAALARKLAEDALRESETMKSAVLASLTSRVAVLDREGRVIAVNESWTRLARERTAHGEAVVGVGESYLEAFRASGERGDDEALEAFVGIKEVLLGERSTFSQEYRVRHAAAERWFHMTVVPLDRPEGGAVVSHADVTERRLAEREAQTSRQELAHYLRVSTIGELTTSIAHELNQPLAAILANAQAARKLLAGQNRPEGVREVREIVSDIIDEGRRAGEVIRGLRELLRKGENTREDLDVNGLVRGVVKLLGNDVMIRGVTLRSDLAEEALATRGNRVQLQQVLMNLVVNALEALAETEGDRRIHIQTERGPGATAQISVEDTGPGLPPPLRREVFKPFFTTKVQGMGMGLSIARSILQAHGGRIFVDDTRRGGARFTLTLPLAEP